MSDMTYPAGLPASVTDRIEFHPIEDVVPAILRPVFEPDIAVHTLIEAWPTFPFILVRTVPTFEAGGDERFVDEATFAIEAFAQDPDGDEKAALISEAVRVALRNAWRTNQTLSGLGTISRIRLHSRPARQPDWATSTGPVQYADLPSGTYRYESRYGIAVRRPL